MLSLERIFAIGTNYEKMGILADEQVLKIVSAFNCKPRMVTRMAKQEELECDVEPLLLCLRNIIVYNYIHMLYFRPPPPENELVKRAPVVAIMGHVDHGKTTLLDCLRKSRIVETEFGGITQHIGAFSLKEGKQFITFLDTPGHAAFAQMRERGAHSTDIVVLVVAADDGVKEQTVQSIKRQNMIILHFRYAKDANVPIIVAVNKCDKPTANPDSTKRELLAHDVIVEDYNGDVLSVNISALYGTNINALKEAILLKAEEMNLRSTPNGLVEGIVIESTITNGCLGIGKTCAMIVQRGTLKKGAYLVCGNSWAKVRSMTDERNRELSAAGPSVPVRVAGWKGSLPIPGDRINGVDSEKKALGVIAYREKKKMLKKAESDWSAIAGQRSEERKKYLANREKLLQSGYRRGSTVRDVVSKEEQWRGVVDDKPCLKIMVFTDVDGTLEVILSTLKTYVSNKVDLKVVIADVGMPSESDLDLALETGAFVYCFNLQLNRSLKACAEKKRVNVQCFNVIYRFVESIKNQLSEMVPTEKEMQIIGEGRVLKEFLVSDRRKKKTVAGVLVKWGTIKRHCTCRYSRGGIIYYEGVAESLQSDNQDVQSVQTGNEVGIAMVDKTVRYKPDDVVVALEEVPVKKPIDWNPPGFE
uniref:Translation initiation factor IF-2, mitochondrial n=1 Tax=Syphacia muris TaxID=451379 RepID=A0A0N5AP46_9BILA